MYWKIRENIITFPAIKSFNYKSVTKHVWDENWRWSPKLNNIVKIWHQRTSVYWKTLEALQK